MVSHLTFKRSAVLIALAGTLALGCSRVTEPVAPIERVYTLEVAPSTVTCTGLLVQQCLQVREQPDRPYTWFYGSIEGFAYEPGYQYLLRVGERTILNPPADGASRALRLIAILAKTASVP